MSKISNFHMVWLLQLFVQISLNNAALFVTPISLQYSHMTSRSCNNLFAIHSETITTETDLAMIHVKNIPEEY